MDRTGQTIVVGEFQGLVDFGGGERDSGATPSAFILSLGAPGS